MLWAMCHGGGFGDPSDDPPIVNEFDWVMKVNYWSHVLHESVRTQALGVPW